MKTIADFQQVFADYLQANRIQEEPEALYQPVNYIMGVGGKRLRPLLTLLGCYLFEEDTTIALPAALAVEVFHNFTLVHDDIMDEAPLRRGKPTVHAQFGLNAGILSGDVMLIKAYDLLLKTPRIDQVRDMVDTFSKVAIKVCEGQQYDIDFEKRVAVELAEYLQMIEWKTAVLLAGSLELGAMAAGASAENRHHLREFGRLTGLAFQLQDDYLDTFGDPEKFGKRVGGDIVQNKKTALIIKALELASAPVQAELRQWYGSSPADPEEKIAAVKKIFLDLGVDAFLRDKRNQCQVTAYQHLEAVTAPDLRKKLLFDLAESLLVREM
ncbi:MAG: polyprenyl synthetase family protein [Lewinella sp.]|nr:polyprenyl synthetase family protein [Lewinella sp.]